MQHSDRRHSWPVRSQTEDSAALLATENGDEGSRARPGWDDVAVPRDAPTLLPMPGRGAGPHRMVPVPSGPLPLAVGIGTVEAPDILLLGHSGRDKRGGHRRGGGRIGPGVDTKWGGLWRRDERQC